METRELLGLGEAAGAVEALSGRRPGPATVWRWARQGIKARNGERVHLGHVRVGGRVLIVAAAILPFFEALANADQGHFDAQRDRAGAAQTLGPSPKRSPKAKADAVAKARRSLKTATR